MKRPEPKTELYAKLVSDMITVVCESSDAMEWAKTELALFVERVHYANEKIIWGDVRSTYDANEVLEYINSYNNRES